MWDMPPYDLDRLQAKARARLLAVGEDPRDSLSVYRMVAVMRTEELRASRQASTRPSVVRVLPAVPEARSARVTESQRRSE